jgi:alpha-glucoside transport system permease protein
MKSARGQKRLNSILLNGGLALLVIVWLIPVFGLLVSSFRERFAIQTSGWWTIFPHKEWQVVRTIDPKALNLDASGPMSVEETIATFEQLREGVETPGGLRLQWSGNRRLGTIEVQQQVWVMNLDFTLDNYKQVWGGKDFEYKRPDGTVEIIPGDDFSVAVFNSLAVSIPATVIPILIALLAVPLQIALVPILRDYSKLGLNGTFLAIWLAHTGFGLPLATYLLFNYISTMPRETLESAFIDGASHFTVFVKLILPLSVPALASFAIFQFLWVWNDYLVALIFLGSDPNLQVVTMRLANIVGDRGQDWHLLTAGAFLTMILPLAVFFSLQRYFVRGMMAGSVKG